MEAHKLHGRSHGRSKSEEQLIVTIIVVVVAAGGAGMIICNVNLQL